VAKKAKKEAKKEVKKAKRTIKKMKKKIAKEKSKIKKLEGTVKDPVAAMLVKCKKLVPAPNGSTDEAGMCKAIKKEGHCDFATYAKYCLESCGSCQI